MQEFPYGQRFSKVWIFYTANDFQRTRARNVFRSSRHFHFYFQPNGSKRIHAQQTRSTQNLTICSKNIWLYSRRHLCAHMRLHVLFTSFIHHILDVSFFAHLMKFFAFVLNYMALDLKHPLLRPNRNLFFSQFVFIISNGNKIVQVSKRKMNHSHCTRVDNASVTDE